MSLSLIKDTVQQAAKAITAALELETEIVDQNLEIIGGTGRYESKIGLFEESGNLDSSKVYALCLKNGQEYFNFDPSSDPLYDAKENELAEICCPIKIDNTTFGLIGLIAFTPEQRKTLIDKTSAFTVFLRIMAELIAGKLVISQNNIHLQNTISSLLSSSDRDASFNNIVSNGPAMENLKKRALQISSSDSTVLITGESGTGKELFARAIHGASPRAAKPFVSINCGAIPEMLLESELFGYEKGSFTGADKNGKAGKFELANTGTIFLDEIGDMPLHLQVKLLRVLQTRQIDKIGGYEPINIDVRIIAATNKNLEDMILQNRFREDLYFRLSVIPLNIPPLRERPEDIPLLIDYAFNKFKERLDKNISEISPKAHEILENYSWPGNVRELENTMEYAINMETGKSIVPENLPDRIKISAAAPLSASDYKGQTDNYQKDLIIACLNETGWDLKGKREAAKRLGISESTLYRRLRK